MISDTNKLNANLKKADAETVRARTKPRPVLQTEIGITVQIVLNIIQYQIRRINMRPNILHMTGAVSLSLEFNL
jgi:hypothetical protein